MYWLLNNTDRIVSKHVLRNNYTHQGWDFWQNSSKFHWISALIACNISTNYVVRTLLEPWHNICVRYVVQYRCLIEIQIWLNFNDFDDTIRWITIKIVSIKLIFKTETTNSKGQWVSTYIHTTTDHAGASAQRPQSLMYRLLAYYIQSVSWWCVLFDWDQHFELIRSIEYFIMA